MTARATCCCWPAGRCGNISSSALCCIATTSPRSTCCCKPPRSGISQEANKILNEFPSTRQDMFDYDCVVAFDPDWQALTRGPDRGAARLGRQPGRRTDRYCRAGKRRQGNQQLDPGPGDWPRSAIFTRWSSCGSIRRWRISPTPPRSPGPWSSPARACKPISSGWAKARRASREVWKGFSGVYSFFPVRGPKPAATVLATFSDPRAADGRQATALFRRAVLRLGAGVLHGQRRNVATPPR